MLTCYLQGGLGNQLFQIFTTINYSLKHKKAFTFTNKKQLDIRRSTYWQTFLQPLAKFIKEINYITTPFFHYKEKEFSYSELPNINNNHILLIGYFQSYKYFTEHAKSIMKLIKLEEQRVKTQITFKKYNFSNTISLHFRRGDYKALKDHYILLDYTYYENALRHIITQSQTPLLNVLVFCEKHDLLEFLSIMEVLKQIYPTLTFEIIDFNISDWLQLLLMSVCKHTIIANSTFSWWGAYFNTNVEKIVCYPDRWFGPKLGHYNTKDLFPAEWKQIHTF
jgi:hypothetical protein